MEFLSEGIRSNLATANAGSKTTEPTTAFRPLSDGVVVMQRNANREAGRNLKLESALNEILATPLLDNPKRRSKP
jgi:hypothetical protein